ncbi:MAG: anthranilate synthase component I family protein [Crocinitomicaceae bacterium]|nr:anthranilate synthase component I family protein [Crocinitomicaceae bacterium]MDC1384907.1 anthranilate synthase component I family protein [Crocinitomicaceae bacterium]
MKTAPLTYLNENDGSGILAFGTGPTFILDKKSDLDAMQSFIDANKGAYIFTTLSYDLKLKIQGLESSNRDSQNYPLATLWVPKTVVAIENEKIKDYLIGEESNENEAFVSDFFDDSQSIEFKLGAKFKARLTKEVYLNQVNDLKNEIQQGNIYEVNFCQEFFAEKVELKDPIQAYFKLNQLTKAPFSCYSSLGNFEIFSGSPERYIKKEGLKLISQPIKGTAKRGQSKEEDLRLKERLLADPKERAENVMIVDLVRNDLSKIARKNSVKVDELFGIYSFETVHQMISTISCEVEETTSFTDVLKATFPMGSMTGAPKHSAMKLIEKHENFKRGIYSGAIGYIAPNGDFDFNVVIRTLIYNRETKYLSCPVGGAITIQSSPEAEYEECNIKVQSILKGMNA